MELFTALMLFFGFLTPSEAGMTPERYDQIISSNQSVVQYYQQEQGEIYVAGTYFPAIDRAED